MTRTGVAKSSSARPKRERLQVSDGTRLSLLRIGGEAAGGTGPTLLFVPGWGMPATVWDAQLTQFGARRQCIALDPRGQGESEAPSHGYTIERRVADLRDVIEQVAPVVLVAWSLAVLEALHYVHLNGAARLKALVLVDNSVGEPPAPTPSDFLQRLRSDRARTVDGFVRGMFATAPDEARIAEIKRSVMRLPVEDSIALLSYPPPREHWRNIVRELRVPLAYLVTPRFEAQAQSLKAHRPATRIEVFGDARHALFIDQPERFNRVLDEFLADALKQ